MTRPTAALGVFLFIWPFISSGFKFSPLSDHNLVPGQVITLNWTPSGTGQIGLEIIRVNNEHSAESIVDNTNNTGTWRWRVSKALRVDTEYFIQIFSYHDYGTSDTFWINDPPNSRSDSTSLASATTDGPSESTTMLTSTLTTLTTAVSAAGYIPTTTTAIPTATSPTSSSPDAVYNGLSSSRRTALAICLALGLPLTCIGLLFRYYAWRYPRRPETEERAAPTFFQWLIRRDHLPPGPENPTDTTREKRASEYTVHSTAVSQGIRSSLATQDTSMWHYKPELPGSDPTRESSTQFLAPVELPAWGPDELDPSGKSETEGQREIHEKSGEEGATQSHTKVE
ncbi:uncharacterized protein TRUGW13939_00950 [Talaromyces rugulosus]|uniref:Yeast cell wall synthesis Kre9/Knh1-like N-terminal domain-containing protein n=1 Tax=Talaromyces rugulosus TaxID=121627 RepID=A0A7H8QIW5_TALRU|nr:uncharacterized protein TRUGW13939_00950 [Talaromyces rugulosus]QKX53870.1 hypothetical protein TRUGW13939_00950 [Talaromyces rugulosus]